MSWRIYYKRYTSATEYDWIFLCMIFDNESLGLLERTTSLELKVEKQ